MSSLATGNPSGAGLNRAGLSSERALPLAIQARIAEVVATLGTAPAVLQGSLKFRIFDLLSHHRRSVGKYHKLPGGRHAQKYLFARMKRKTWYGRDGGKAGGGGAVGLGFVEAEARDEQAGRFGALESGRRIQASGWMLMPILGALRAAGFAGRAPRGRAFRLAEELRAQGKLRVVRSRGGKLLLVFDTGRRRDGSLGRAARSIPLFILSRTRTQRPLLGYFEQWRRVSSSPRTIAKFEADLERCLTEAGRLALTRRNERALSDQEITNIGRAEAAAARRAGEAAARKDTIDGAAPEGRSA